MKTYLFCVLAMSVMVPGMFSSLAEARDVVVGIYQNAPLVFTDSDGKPKGVFIDVFDYIAQKEGWKVEYRPGTWPECLERLNNGDVDLLAAMADSEERRNRYAYPDEPVLSNWGVIYTRDDLELHSMMALTGRKVAGLKDGIFYVSFKPYIKKFQIFPRFVEVQSYPEMLKLLDEGLVDAGILPRIYGAHHESEYNIKKSAISFSPIDLHFTALKDQHAELLHAIGTHVKELKKNKNSMYYKTLNVWIEGVHRLTFPKWLQPRWVLSFLAVFITMILSGIMILRWQLRLRTRALQETISAKEKIESELRIAHEIQMESVPGIFPAFPERNEFDIHAVLEPAREVGGDFYDFFFLDDDHLCFIIGDVSGKGVPAALFMSAVKTLAKATAKRVHTPAALLTAVNLELAPENESCTFVTVFCGILNVHSGEVYYTNAGHNPPFLLRQNGAVEGVEGPRSTIVGVDEDAVFHEATFTLLPGESICLYTDGVTEAFNVEREMFSEERFQEELASYPQGSMHVLVQAILSRVKAFAGEMPQTDDITVLALQYLGSEV
jgi:serine phosphatase RsbU (regulator of sigma subunit)/ABC-type amino acid transport substrate-binding protein